MGRQIGQVSARVMFFLRSTTTICSRSKSSIAKSIDISQEHKSMCDIAATRRFTTALCWSLAWSKLYPTVDDCSTALFVNCRRQICDVFSLTQAECSEGEARAVPPIFVALVYAKTGSARSSRRNWPVNEEQSIGLFAKQFSLEWF